MPVPLASCLFLVCVPMLQPPPDERSRPGALGVRIGSLPSGAHDAITDVAGVAVGHCTVRRGDDVRTGVTVVLPHGGNPFRDKVPAAVAVYNAFGKLIGATQVRELGNLESPIALTNTLNAPKVADALIGWILEQPGNEDVRSVNAVVGETNDGWLNDSRGRHVEAEHVREALREARGGPVAGGAVGAGTGTVCFGWKGGIGTASRQVDGWTVGVLVQTNFGGELTIAGAPVHRHVQPPRREGGQRRRDGSCMIVIATDAPLQSRNLERLAQRAFAGMARTGASFADGSGDYAIAFSTAPELRVRDDGQRTTGGPELRNDRMSPLFLAAAEATEAAIVDALFRAVTTTGCGRTVEALPVEKVKALLDKR
jgi:D-aminopeptidase